jgi:hypothetical protein
VNSLEETCIAMIMKVVGNLVALLAANDAGAVDASAKGEHFSNEIDTAIDQMMWNMVQCVSQRGA